MRICDSLFLSFHIKPFHYSLENWRNEIPPPVLTRFFIFHKIQRPKPLTIGQIYAGPLQPDTMMKCSLPLNAPMALPSLVAAYVDATNSFDLDRLMVTFAEDALVNDQLRD